MLFSLKTYVPFNSGGGGGWGRAKQKKIIIKYESGVTLEKNIDKLIQTGSTKKCF